MRFLAIAAKVFPILLATSSTLAIANPRIEVEIGPYAEWSDNPQLLSGGGNDAAQLGARIAPRVTWQGEASQTELSGRAEYQTFTRLFDDRILANVALENNTQLSPTLSWSGRATYDRSEPQVIDSPELIANLANGTRTRYGASTQLQFQPSARRLFAIGGAASIERLPTQLQGAVDNEQYSAFLSARQIFSDRLTAGLRANGSLFRPDNQSSVDQLSPAVVLTYRISETLTFDATAGVTFSWLDANPALGTPKADSTDLLLSASLCRDAGLTQYCLKGGVSQRGGSNGAVQETIDVGVTLGHQFSELLDIGAEVRYSETSQAFDVAGLPGAFGVDADSFGANARLNYRLSEALRVSGNIGYRERTNNFGASADSFRVGVALSWTMMVQ